jgi:riboflavin kinase
MKNSLPFFASGRVVKGFGRGSKTLGTPTANFEQSIVDLLPADLPKGIYFGWAQVNRSPVYKMVTSIGWNPYFGNQVKSMVSFYVKYFLNKFKLN